jgi:DNA-binding LacI/PurR family transcriptional regulator
MFESLSTNSMSVPLVAVGCGVDERFSIVAVDQRMGASLAVQHPCRSWP